MSQSTSDFKTGLLNLAEVAWIDLPSALTLRTFRAEKNGELAQAGWKAYQAATGVVTDLTNRAYANRSIAKVSARVLENGLKTQHVLDAVAGAFFSALWPSLGLPMASDIEALRRDVKALREEVRTIAYNQETDEVSREAESARETAIREASIGARAHEDFDWSGWRALPAVEVRNRVRR